MHGTIRVADEVWIATALLHREQPDRHDFAVSEILERALHENLTGKRPLRPGVRTHAVQHCVASKRPNPGNMRMLTETGRGRRRLFVEGDRQDPGRRNGKAVPVADEIPPAYRELLDWYASEYAAPRREPDRDPLLSLRGSGNRLWADEAPDAYVERLRQGWS